MLFQVIAASEAHVDLVLQEIYRRRGIVLDGGELVRGTCAVKCRIPLAELQGFPKNVRIITSGHASIHVEMGGYQDVPEQKQKEIVNMVRVGHC